MVSRKYRQSENIEDLRRPLAKKRHETKALLGNDAANRVFDEGREGDERTDRANFYNSQFPGYNRYNRLSAKAPASREEFLNVKEGNRLSHLPFSVIQKPKKGSPTS